jgi:hypothetical protein
MGTGRKFRKKPMTRPRKSGAERRRRDAVQRRRLAALGVPEEKLRKLTTAGVRKLLVRPAKTAAGL